MIDSGWEKSEGAGGHCAGIVQRVPERNPRDVHRYAAVVHASDTTPVRVQAPNGATIQGLSAPVAPAASANFPLLPAH